MLWLMYRTQLILVDGSILAGLAEVIIPKWREQSIFWRILRSIVVGVLKVARICLIY